MNTQQPSLNSSAWNKGKLIGQKQPLKRQEIWAIRIRLQIRNDQRQLAMFNIAIDSKLRSCDLVNLKVKDIANCGTILKRTMVMQQKTGRPVQFELTPQTRESLKHLINDEALIPTDYVFRSRKTPSTHLSTRQYARIVKSWVTMIGLDLANYGTHSMRRTKATLIYKQTKNIRAVQLLLGHTKIDSTIRYLGIEVDDALDLAEHIEA